MELIFRCLFCVSFCSPEQSLESRAEAGHDLGIAPSRSGGTWRRQDVLGLLGGDFISQTQAFPWWVWIVPVTNRVARGKEVWGAFSATGAVWQWESRESLGSVCGPVHGFSSEAPNGDTSG